MGTEKLYQLDYTTKDGWIRVISEEVSSHARYISIDSERKGKPDLYFMEKVDDRKRSFVHVGILTPQGQKLWDAASASVGEIKGIQKFTRWRYPNNLQIIKVFNKENSADVFSTLQNTAQTQYNSQLLSGILFFCGAPLPKPFQATKKRYEEMTVPGSSCFWENVDLEISTQRNGHHSIQIQQKYGSGSATVYVSDMEKYLPILQPRCSEAIQWYEKLLGKQAGKPKE